MSEEAWFKIDITPEFLRVETFGQRSGRASEELWRAVSKASAESGSKKILLTSYRDGSLPVGSIESLAEKYRDSITDEHRFALVFMEKDFESESIGETIAQSVGINLRAFRDNDAALKWLLSDE